MTKKWLIRGLGLLLLIAGCAGLEVGRGFRVRPPRTDDRGLRDGAVLFQPIAKRDPNYVAPFSSFRESIWTYLGRAQYQSGKLSEAKMLI